MPRDIDNQLAQTMQENYRSVVLVHIDFETPLYVHSRFGELTYNGNTYYGVGALGSISTRQEDTELNPQRLMLGLTGIPLRFIDQVNDGNYQNRDVYIYKGILDTNETLLGSTAIKWFRGVTGNASISESANGTCKVDLEVANWLAKWRRASGLRYNNEIQQELYSGDTGLQYVIAAQKGLAWRGV